MNFLSRLCSHSAGLLHNLMSFTGGFLGLYAMCAYGNFGSAQTGNLMGLVIDLVDGNALSLLARIGALLLFSGGIALSWLLSEFRTLPMRELCLLTDAAGLALSASLPEAVPPFLRLYPIFFASSFQWGSFGGVKGRASTTLFLTGNLKSCVIFWMKFCCYRRPEDWSGAWFYTLTILCFLSGGILGCVSVRAFGVLGAYCGYLPLLAAAGVLAAERWCARAERPAS